MSEQAPPILKSWRNLYWLLLVMLVIYIVVFELLMYNFS
jgi:hypothetical protein